LGTPRSPGFSGLRHFRQRFRQRLIGKGLGAARGRASQRHRIQIGALSIPGIAPLLLQRLVHRGAVTQL
jgi:hypothetical protein